MVRKTASVSEERGVSTSPGRERGWEDERSTFPSARSFLDLKSPDTGRVWPCLFERSHEANDLEIVVKRKIKRVISP